MVVALIGPIGINPNGVTAKMIMIAKNIAVKVKLLTFSLFHLLLLQFWIYDAQFQQYLPRHRDHNRRKQASFSRFNFLITNFF